MPLIGLSGGFAAGKSLVSSIFERNGAHILDCDVYARDAVEPGSEGLKKVAKKFGSQVLNDDGSLNRGVLANVVFCDENLRKQLESILHPLIRHEIFRASDRIFSDNRDAVVIVDAALLFEGGLYKSMDCNIVVTCTEAQQVDRGMKRDGLSMEDVRKRISTQWPLSKKVELADYVIDNSGTIAKTGAEVLQTLALIKTGT